ncbi:MAG: hypothetical protein RMJ88_16425 [Thermogemmata sp.]|nr:hypothetical protein [Thermogemmata sp.]
MKVTSCLFLVILVSAIQTGQSDEEQVSLIRSEITKAETAYREAIDKAKKLVLDALDAKDQEARANQDLQLLEKVRTEKTKFLRNESFPTTINMNEYHVAVAVARSDLMKAYLTARNQYVKLGKLHQAKILDAELDKLIAKAKLNFVPVTTQDPPDPAQQAKVEDQDSRTLWVHSEGYFMKGLGKDWFELWDFGRKPPFLFIETHRNSEFVELVRRVDQAIVRLYNDRMLVKFPGRKSFEFHYEGKWQKAAP